MLKSLLDTESRVLWVVWVDLNQSSSRNLLLWKRGAARLCDLRHVFAHQETAIVIFGSRCETMEATSIWILLPLVVCHPPTTLRLGLQQFAVFHRKLNMTQVWDIRNSIHQVRHLTRISK